MLRCAVVLAGLAGCSSLAAADDCRSSGCDNGGSCCMCSCDAGDYVVGSFSCNCDDTPKHKPLPNADQPKCCGGEFGFDAWCLKQDSPAVNNLQCSDQTPKGKPLPFKDFYEFSTSNFRCVYPPATCLSAFCDNPAVPDLNHHVCHKPYEPSPGPAPEAPAPKAPAPKAPAPKAPAPKAPAPKAPAPKAPAPKAPAPKAPAPKTPAPSTPPSPATCAADANRPNGCACGHSFQCASEWCAGKPAKCEKHPGSLRANADSPGAKPALF